MSRNRSTGTGWLKSLSRFGEKPGLERTRRVLAAFGDPQSQLRFYHVAGTNGKGSVCAYLTALFSVTMKVGTFTSPAFDGYRGRFVVSGQTISDDVFGGLAEQVRTVSERVNPGDPLTEFEALTVMAILYFSEKCVEAVVWETGLGGTYDSTNVVMPELCAITNVSFDHTEILGSTIRQIALDKAGIIKPNRSVITATKDDAYLVVERTARDQGARLFTFGRSFGGVRTAVQPTAQRMDYRGVDRDLHGLWIPLFGAHQIENAAVALAMYEVACARGTCDFATDQQIRCAMAEVKWPGRFEVIGNHPPLVLDGAHNPDGARRFAQSLAEYSEICGLPDSDWTMVVGVLREKDIHLMLEAVLPFAGRVVATQPQSARARSNADLKREITRCRPDLPVVVYDTVADAMRHVQRTAEREREAHPVCCWGSLYTVDEARQAMVQQGEVR